MNVVGSKVCCQFTLTNLSNRVDKVWTLIHTTDHTTTHTATNPLTHTQTTHSALHSDGWKTGQTARQEYRMDIHETKAATISMESGQQHNNSHRWISQQGYHRYNFAVPNSRNWTHLSCAKQNTNKDTKTTTSRKY